jgi:hypothetical protein
MKTQKTSREEPVEREHQEFVNYVNTQKGRPDYLSTAIQMATQINSTVKAFNLPFSSFRWAQVAELLNIDDDPEGPPSLELEKYADEDDTKAAEVLSGEILEQLKKSVAVLGDMSLGKETKRLFFIYDILRPIVLHLQQKYPSIRIEVESEIAGQQAHGFAELVIKVGAFSLLIVEAKQADIPQGRAQLFMEMWSAQESRADESGNVSWGDIYGLVTTGQLYFPFCLDSNRKFTHGNGCSLNNRRPTLEEVKELVQTISVMLTLCMPADASSK